MSTVDYNVDNYTIPELLAILEVDIDLSSNLLTIVELQKATKEIANITNNYISKYAGSSQSAPLVRFFQNIQTKLLRYTNQLNRQIENGEIPGTDTLLPEYSPNDEQTDNWYQYQNLPQDNSVQRDKITDRRQKIDIYDNNHVPMKQEQLGVTNTISVPVAQDSLNPNLKNITTRFINLDSQFRQTGKGSQSQSTDYTLDLSDPLTNVLSLRLYSIQIPFTWYVIDYQYGNTCFWVTNAGINFRIFVEPGNYTPDTFCTALNTAFTNPANFAPPYVDHIGYTGFAYGGSIVPTPKIVTYNANNGKITICLDGWKDPSGKLIVTIAIDDTFDSSKDSYITFFDFNGYLNCLGNGNGCSASMSFNSTLGWLMGYRLPVIALLKTPGNTGTAVLDLYGSKYFIIVLDDYNQNHINNGLISITELSTKLSMPSYYNTSMPYVCNTMNSPLFSLNNLGSLSAITPEQAAAAGLDLETMTGLIQEKLDSTSPSQVILPSAPRTLTQAQIYTINEIIRNRGKTTSYKGKAPTNSDTFALIPIKRSGLTIGDMYTEFSGSMQDNKRIYFGPVNIDRLRIRLIDDRGYVVDLHGVDWCITIISENLYQY